ncbi:unnamed protein product, partial [Vitis vinifera]
MHVLARYIFLWSFAKWDSLVLFNLNKLGGSYFT